jgi:archaellum component FlaC
MKKSEINTEDLIEDIDKLLDILNRVGENNIEDIDIDNIKNEIQKIQEEVNEKYPENLDSEE